MLEKNQGKLNRFLPLVLHNQISVMDDTVVLTSKFH